MNRKRIWINGWCGLLLWASGCGPGAATGGVDMSPPSNTCDSTSQLKFAMKQVNLPVMPGYKSDVDGDGTSENRLGTVISTLEGMGLDLQNNLNTDVKSGKFLMMADMQGPSMMSGCANVVVHSGDMPAMAPKYDGSDSFKPKPGETPVTLPGTLAGGTLQTTRPKDQAPAAVSKLQMSVPMLGNVRLPITIYGAQMTGGVSGTGVMSGELHGVVRKKDIDDNVIPMVAQALTNQINADPTSNLSKYYTNLFEDQSTQASKDKCTSSPSMCCAKNPATCKLTSAELLANPIIQNITAPDVQMFSGDTWAPVAGGTQKDSLSFGAGFSASKASF